MTGQTATAPALFRLDEERREFQSMCRAVVRDKVVPLVDRAEEDGTFPSELWGELGRTGLLGLGYPEAVGGAGGGVLEIAIFSEELAKASGGIAVTPLVSSYMAAPHLYRHGSEAQKQRWLRGILDGGTVAAIAVSEPGAGSDVAGIATTAKPVDGGWALNGAKIFITNGGIADVLIVAARTDPTERHRGLTMFLVEKDSPGFDAGRPLRKMGWHSSDTRELFLQDCRVPSEAVVGDVGRGFYQIMEAFQTERVVLAAMGVGLAQACLDDAVEYARERAAFGRPIGNLQVIRHALGEMKTEVEAARLLTYRSAAMIDAGEDFADAVAMAKLFTARAANHVADRAVQIFGGYGFLEETRVAMHYRDARVLRIGGGTDEVQLEVLAKGMDL
jgi:acyl-CoA dehydrogenase/citronellyl-CoA dehydrogenase